jgi:HPt (histidine-containing phosphotransfer) domain-containing protein
VLFSFCVVVLRPGRHFETKRKASKTIIYKFEIEDLHRLDNRLYDSDCMEPSPKTTVNQSQIQQQQAWMKLTQRYLADLPQQLQAMRQCLDRGDLVNLQRQAHRAKGTSGTYRLAKIAEHFSRLESLVLQDTGQDIPPLLDQLTALVAEATERCTT